MIELYLTPAGCLDCSDSLILSGSDGREVGTVSVDVDNVSASCVCATSDSYCSVPVCQAHAWQADLQVF
jgi:hypothetical protein